MYIDFVQSKHVYMNAPMWYTLCMEVITCPPMQKGEAMQPIKKGRMR